MILKNIDRVSFQLDHSVLNQPKMRHEKTMR